MPFAVRAVSSSMLYLVVAVAAVAAYLYFTDSGDRDDRPPSYEASTHRRDERQSRHSVESRRDHTHAPARPSLGQSVEPPQTVATPAEDPASLRTRAKREADLMSQCFQQSKDAYERRDHARAKSLSEEGKRHESTMKNLHAQASASIFKENNRDKAPCEIDLHGLYVKEAITYTDKAIAQARQRGDSEIRLIVGKGIHTDGGIPKLKPAIQEDMRTRGIPVEVDPKNPGVLLVRVGGK